MADSIVQIENATYAVVGEITELREKLNTADEQREELLEALNDAADALITLSNRYEYFDASDAYEDARKALAKAKGGA